MKQKETIEIDDNENILTVAVEADKEELIDRIIDNEKGIKINKAWQSKYNTYVVYEYAPFCTQGFILNYTIEGKINRLIFLKEIITRETNKVAFLENCLSKPDGIHPVNSIKEIK